MRDYAEGRLQVLTNVDLFGEGFDLASVAERDVSIDCVMQMRPTQSLALHLQQVGRGLRPGDGKVAVILDHAGKTSTALRCCSAAASSARVRTNGIAS